MVPLALLVVLDYGAFAGERALMRCVGQLATVHSSFRRHPAVRHVDMRRAKANAALVEARTRQDVERAFRDGADAVVDALHNALWCHPDEVVHELIRRTPVEAIDTVDVTEETPLHNAVHEQRWSCVRELIAHGADVNAKFPDGDTMLHYSIRNDLDECTAMLLTAPNIDVNQKERIIGDTPLHMAVDGYKIEDIINLIQHGADPNIENDAGDPPLFSAVHNAHLDVIQILMEAGAKPDFSILSWAASEGLSESLWAVLEFAAIGPGVRTKIIENLAHTARTSGNAALYRELKYHLRYLEM